MAAEQRPSAPGFVVIRQVEGGRWEVLGEVYAAVQRSEWRVALDWSPPPSGS
jgi:hypothetical protein